MAAYFEVNDTLSGRIDACLAYLRNNRQNTQQLSVLGDALVELANSGSFSKVLEVLTDDQSSDSLVWDLPLSSLHSLLAVAVDKKAVELISFLFRAGVATDASIKVSAKAFKKIFGDSLTVSLKNCVAVNCSFANKPVTKNKALAKILITTGSDFLSAMLMCRGESAESKSNFSFPSTCRVLLQTSLKHSVLLLTAFSLPVHHKRLTISPSEIIDVIAPLQVAQSLAPTYRGSLIDTLIALYHKDGNVTAGRSSATHFSVPTDQVDPFVLFNRYQSIKGPHNVRSSVTRERSLYHMALNYLNIVSRLPLDQQKEMQPQCFFMVLSALEGLYELVAEGAIDARIYYVSLLYKVLLPDASYRFLNTVPVYLQQVVARIGFATMGPDALSLEDIVNDGQLVDDYRQLIQETVTVLAIPVVDMDIGVRQQPWLAAKKFEQVDTSNTVLATEMPMDALILAANNNQLTDMQLYLAYPYPLTVLHQALNAAIESAAVDVAIYLFKVGAAVDCDIAISVDNFLALLADRLLELQDCLAVNCFMGGLPVESMPDLEKIFITSQDAFIRKLTKNHAGRQCLPVMMNALLQSSIRNIAFAYHLTQPYGKRNMLHMIEGFSFEGVMPFYIADFVVNDCVRTYNSSFLKELAKSSRGIVTLDHEYRGYLKRCIKEKAAQDGDYCFAYKEDEGLAGSRFIKLFALFELSVRKGEPAPISQASCLYYMTKNILDNYDGRHNRVGDCQLFLMVLASLEGLDQLSRLGQPEARLYHCCLLRDMLTNDYKFLAPFSVSKRHVIILDIYTALQPQNFPIDQIRGDEMHIIYTDLLSQCMEYTLPETASSASAPAEDTIALMPTVNDTHEHK